jgi:hypothetical protein
MAIGSAFRLRARFVAATLACLLLLGPALMGSASAQPFNPIRALTTWYTDRSLVDVEIVGSTSTVPEFHQLEPERTLRFRLERAYIDILTTKKEPGFEFVAFSFDMETGLPHALFVAVANRAKFHEDIAGVPVLSHADEIRRTLLVSIKSDAPATALRRGSESIRKCARSPLGNELWTLDWQGLQDCRRPKYPRATAYIAEYDDHLALRMECPDEKLPVIGCELQFPFEGFSVDISFHRDHLNNWRDMIRRVSEFLRSRQYR